MSLSSRDIPASNFPPTAKGTCELMAEAHRRLGGHEPVEAFLLRHGQEFEVNPTPDWVELGTPKMCFMNAYLLVDEQREGLLGEEVPELFYCEGYVLSSGLPIPIHHAWCVTADGTLIEPTLPDQTDEERVTYFGVKVPDFDDLARVVEETGTYSLLFKRLGHEAIERFSAKTSGSSGDG